MLIFIIPLKSPQVSKSWEYVSQLFERCVSSVCNQTSPDFRVIVVCHEKPNIEFSHPHLTYIKVDFPIPKPDWLSKELDKARKILAGIIYARELGASHIMTVDADDCVSNQLADFVSSHPHANGWFFPKGYYYHEGSKFIRIMRKGFDQYCGTSHIIKSNLYDLPNTTDPDKAAQAFSIFSRHKMLKETLNKKGISLEKLPFAGAIYITKHTESLNDEFLKARVNKVNLRIIFFRTKCLLDYRPITKEIREMFGLR